MAASPGEIRDKWEEYERKYEEAGAMLGKALALLVDLQDVAVELFEGAGGEGRRVLPAVSSAVRHTNEAILDVEAAAEAGAEYVSYL